MKLDHSSWPEHIRRNIRDGATTDNLNELAPQAWKQAMDDAKTAVWLLRESTDLGLREAFELIQKTAAQIGARCDLHIMSFAELPAALAEAIHESEYEQDTARLSAHRAARGVRKVRGVK